MRALVKKWDMPRAGYAVRTFDCRPPPVVCMVGLAVKTADDIDAYIGSRVRLRRMTIGVSQEQLGDALGLTFQQVQKYEKGQNRIGAGRLYRIAQILSTPVGYFYEGLPPTADEVDSERVVERSVGLQAFVASSDGHALSLAFQRIEDPATRRRIVDLVSTIADGESN